MARRVTKELRGDSADGADSAEAGHGRWGRLMSLEAETELEQARSRETLTSVAERARAMAEARDVKVGLNVYLQCYSGQDVLKALEMVDGIRWDPRLVVVELLRKGLLVPAQEPKGGGKTKFTEDGLFRFDSLDTSSRVDGEDLADEAANMGLQMPLPSIVVTDQEVPGRKRGHARSATFNTSELPGRGPRQFSTYTICDDSCSETSCNTLDEEYYEESHPQERFETIARPWTPAEDEELGMAVSQHGDKWFIIHHSVPGRSEDECRERWESKCVKTSSARTSRKGSFWEKIWPFQGQSRSNRACDASTDASLPAGAEIRYPTPRTTTEQKSSMDLDFENSASAALSHSKESLVKMKSRKSLPSSGITPEDKEVETLGRKALCDIVIVVMGLSNPPPALRGFRELHYYVKVEFGKCKVKTRHVVEHPGSGISWTHRLHLNGVTTDTELSIRVFTKHRVVKGTEIGKATITVGDLARRPNRDLVLADRNDNLVVGADQESLSLLRIGIDKATIPEFWPMPVPSQLKFKTFEKHLMITTRGTRGDVQPFIALARGLASKYNWMITIVTEMRYRDYVKRYASEDLPRGCIRFRVSGGDTQRRVDSNISKWAMNLKNGWMQHMMLAMSEAEFFASEPPTYYWAKSMKPDYLMFGFTMASVAMIVSEALGIPLMGFILQPSCIPSNHYAPVIPLDEKAYRKMIDMKTLHKDHANLNWLKVLAENNPLTGELNTMRKKRGLGPVKRTVGSSLISQAFQSTTYPDLQNLGVPLIVPINQLAFGGLPPDWGPKTVLTNYIFLRGNSVPQLKPSHELFIKNSKAAGRKLVCLAFSSMPVERLDIFRVALRIIKECNAQASVVALIGSHTDDPGKDRKVEKLVQQFSQEGRLLVDSGAPFGRLFPEMDCVIAHGGLGTTGEAIMCEVPVIVTGVLLFDQRFWGMRCKEMGLGPFPQHISSFMKNVTKLVDEALEPDSNWAANAKVIGKRIAETMADDPSGVDINATTVHDMAQEAPVFRYIRPN
mmetsp:Transcript_2467/g.4774  ORF Transcript_2467/g.4774 Transcript_2467/m.4774 type:complete len:1014 (+) Transcript_2467:114-3155(+)